MQHLGVTTQISDGSFFPLEQFQHSAGQSAVQEDRELRQCLPQTLFLFSTFVMLLKNKCFSSLKGDY